MTDEISIKLTVPQWITLWDHIGKILDDNKDKDGYIWYSNLDDAHDKIKEALGSRFE